MAVQRRTRFFIAYRTVMRSILCMSNTVTPQRKKTDWNKELPVRWKLKLRRVSEGSFELVPFTKFSYQSTLQLIFQCIWVNQNLNCEEHFWREFYCVFSKWTISTSWYANSFHKICEWHHFPARAFERFPLFLFLNRNAVVFSHLVDLLSSQT